MSNPYVHGVSHFRTVDGLTVPVGVDYDAVTIGEYRLDRDKCEEYARAFIAACWEAADNARLMAEEAGE